MTPPSSINSTVVDNVLPDIVCPGTKTRSTDQGRCDALVTYNNPTATDNCSPPPLAPTLMHVSCGTATAQGASTIRATFPTGITTFTWRAIHYDG